MVRKITMETRNKVTAVLSMNTLPYNKGEKLENISSYILVPLKKFIGLTEVFRNSLFALGKVLLFLLAQLPLMAHNL